jgi:CRISPR-associated protein Csx10
LPIPLSIQFPKSGEITPMDLLFANSEAPPTKHRAGYCLLQDGSFAQVAVDTQINFHHRRTNPLVGRSVNSEIFNYEAVNAAQTFVAAIIGSEERLQKFQETMGRRVFYARLGRSKNTQYGRVEIDFVRASISSVDETWRGDKAIEVHTAEPCFNLTLLSHLILPNEYGQAAAGVAALKSRLLGEFQAEGLSLDERQLRLERSFARSTDIENYVAVWKARKPAVAALRMGSCFRFRFDGLDAAALQKAGATLARLQEHGLGLRRHEGFGRLAVNWQTDEALKNVTREREAEQSKKLGAQPEAAPPAMLKQILRATLQAHLAAQTRLRAMQKLEAFVELPAGAQISRLLSLVEGAKDERAFKNMLSQLRESAKTQLRECRTKDHAQSLLEFLESSALTGKEGGLQALAPKEMRKEEVDLCKIIGYDPAADADLRNRLFELYFTTFFALMRRAESIERRV